MEKIILIGNLGKAPETHQTKKGDKTFFTASIGVAVYNFKEKENETVWYDIIFPEFLEKRVNLLDKGTKVYLEGSLAIKPYVNKDDETVFSRQIAVREMEILSKIAKKEDEDEDEDEDDAPKKKSSSKEKEKSKKKPSKDDDDDDDESDDLPF